MSAVSSSKTGKKQHAMLYAVSSNINDVALAKCGPIRRRCSQVRDFFMFRRFSCTLLSLRADTLRMLV